MIDFDNCTIGPFIVVDEVIKDEDKNIKTALDIFHIQEISECPDDNLLTVIRYGSKAAGIDSDRHIFIFETFDDFMGRIKDHFDRFKVGEDD